MARRYYLTGNAPVQTASKTAVVSVVQVIFEDGKEVVNTTSMLNTDFAHGWSSLATRRLYRVEANLTMNGELAFIFSVDGVPYIEFPQKHQLKRTPSSHLSGGRYGDDGLDSHQSTSSASAQRRASTGSVSTTPATSRPASTASSATASKSSTTHNSVSKAGDSSFDPFATGSSSSAAFDPFADDFGGSSSTTTTHSQTKATPKVAGGAATTVSRPPSGTTKTTPTAAAHHHSITPKTSSAALLFDEAPPAHGAADQGGFDAFADSADPFTASKPAAPATSAAFDPFATAAPAKAAAQPTPAHSAPAFDPFDDHHHQAQPAKTATAAPARRGSALDDLAGLSYGPTPAQQLAASRASQQTPPPAAVAAAEPVAVNEEAAAPKDPWQTNLVDLDLSGRAKDTTRRASINQGGPSLKELMQSNGGVSSSSSSSVTGRGSFTTGSSAPFPSNDPFGAPPLLQASAPVNPFSSSTNDLFTASTNAYRPMSTSDAISSLGGGAPAAPMMAPGNVRGSMIMSMPPPMPPTMGGGPANGVRPLSGPPAMGGGSAMGGNTGRSSFIMAPGGSGLMGSGPGGNHNQPKSSLDALDWRAMS